ncbi:MAG TPA: hypothetical protein VEB22_12030 [Phycisphaerales bacterium]|nr:hypothetical protein [Phycisphaerales bacterium]
MAADTIRILTVDGDLATAAEVEFALELDDRFKLVGHLASDERLCEAIRTREPHIVLVMMSEDPADGKGEEQARALLQRVLAAIGDSPEPRVIALVERDTPDSRSLVLDGGAWGMVVKSARPGGEPAAARSAGRAGPGASTFGPSLRNALVAVSQGRVAFP